MSKARRIVITYVHKNDAYYLDRDQLIGSTGEFKPAQQICNLKGFFAGSFTPDKESKAAELAYKGVITLYAIRYKRI